MTDNEANPNDLYGLSWNVTLTGAADGTPVLVARAHFCGTWVDPKDGVTTIDASCRSYRVKETVEEVDKLFSFHTGILRQEVESTPGHIMAVAPTHAQADMFNGAADLLQNRPDMVARLALCLDNNGTRFVRSLALLAGDVPVEHRDLDDQAKVTVLASALASLSPELRARAIAKISHLLDGSEHDA